jgi:F420-nonreducing hydrogenase I cytochrome b subunit
MKMPQTVKVLRHTLFWRILHWFIFFAGVFLVLTGMQRGGMLPITVFPADSDYYYYSTHVAVGLLFIAASILVAYEMLSSGEYFWVSIRRIPYSFRFIANETRAWFGIWPPMKEPIQFDQTNHKYKEKMIPSAIVVWWAFIVLGWVQVLSGLGLAFPAQFSFVYIFSDALGIAITGVGGYAFLVALHRFATILLVILVALHIYTTFIYKLVRSSIFGYKEELAV